MRLNLFQLWPLGALPGGACISLLVPIDARLAFFSERLLTFKPLPYFSRYFPPPRILYTSSVYLSPLERQVLEGRVLAVFGSRRCPRHFRGRSVGSEWMGTPAGVKGPWRGVIPGGFWEASVSLGVTRILPARRLESPQVQGGRSLSQSLPRAEQAASARAGETQWGPRGGDSRGKSRASGPPLPALGVAGRGGEGVRRLGRAHLRPRSVRRPPGATRGWSRAAPAPPRQVRRDSWRGGRARAAQGGARPPAAGASDARVGAGPASSSCGGSAELGRPKRSPASAAGPAGGAGTRAAGFLPPHGARRGTGLLGAHVPARPWFVLLSWYLFFSPSPRRSGTRAESCGTGGRGLGSPGGAQGTPAVGVRVWPGARAAPGPSGSAAWGFS